MRQQYRDALARAGDPAHEWRSVPSTGDDRADRRKQEAMLKAGWSWIRSEIGPKPHQIRYIYRRPWIKPKGG